MFEVTQTILMGDGSGREGNCLQAVVASLLDLPLDKVPHFLESPDWWVALVTFMRTQGLNIYRLPASAPAPQFGVAIGPSSRGVTHAIAYCDGADWDPHPSRDGLVDVDFFVAIEPIVGGA